MPNRRSRITLADLPQRYAQQVYAQLGATAEPQQIVEAKAGERRIRQSRDSLNKLETAFFDIAKCQHSPAEVIPQSVRLRLGNGLWYKPDFFVPDESLFYEVKGPKAFRGGLENLKAAASAHKWARFILVWRVSGEWKRQEVLS